MLTINKNSSPTSPTGFAAPGMLLMGFFSFPIKAVIISSIFLMPLMYLMVNLYRAQSAQIQFTEKERHGVRIMAAFQPVMHGLLNVRNATRAGLAGGTFETSTDYKIARKNVDEALNALEIAVEKSNDPLTLSSEVANLKNVFAITANSNSGVDENGRTVFGPVTTASVEFLQRLGDNSNLVLDPDLDSFYIINALVLTLPQSLEDLGQLWGWGTFAIQKGYLPPADERRYAVWDAGAITGIKSARQHFGRAVQYNPSLESQLDISGLETALIFREKVKSVDDMTSSDLTAPMVYSEGKQAVNAAMDVYQSGLHALDSLLLQRQIKLKQVLWYSLASVIAAILLAIYFFYAFYKVMYQGLSVVEGHLGELAAGDFSRRPVPFWARDESAVLISYIESTYVSLHDLIRNVRHVSGELNTASHEIAAASSDLAIRTATSASALEQQANSITNIGSKISETAKTVQQAATFSYRNSEVAIQAGATITQVDTTMKGIHESSAKINDIIGVIDGIAFQTNILALNAAVEAARAGDSGRGFAVVANEVRTLAQRSAVAAKEIKSLISSSVGKISEGTLVVQNAGNIMLTVIENAREVNTLLGQIATSSQAQSIGVEAAVSAIQELDRDMHQNAALVEETDAAATALKSQAENLNSDIQRFRTD